MSLILKGIDLPKASNDDILIILQSNGEARCNQQGKSEKTIEAIQIPTPHGRLIAEGSITDQLQKIEDITALYHIDLGEEPYDDTDEIMLPISTIRKILDRCITILEAEE